MKKKDVSEALAELFGALESNRVCPLYPKDFIVIGGGSLVLQDMLEETSDIDILTKRYRDLIEFHPKIAIEDIDDDSYYFVFHSSGREFNVLARREARDLIAGRIFKKQKLCVDGTKIYVRPARLVAKDYHKALKEMKSEAGGNSYKIEEYMERLKKLPSPRLFNFISKPAKYLA